MADDALFCGACGKKQVTLYQQTFRREKMSEEEFINRINAWFAQYPKVANVKGEFLLKHASGLLVNKYVLDAFAIEYELLSGNNTNQYAVVQLSKFGFVRKETNDLLAAWKQKNPGAIVVARDGGVNQRGDTGSLMLNGFGANNNTQLYVLFKFNRKLGPGLPSPSNG